MAGKRHKMTGEKLARLNTYLKQRAHAVQTIQELQRTLRRMRNKHLCEALGISPTTLRYYRDMLGYPLQRAARKGARGCGAAEVRASRIEVRA